MKILSVNVGLPTPYEFKGKKGLTSIFKSPVDGEKKVTKLNIEGDEQADLTVHGGELKAVYSYDISYYALWKKILQRDDWTYGLFGENLTTEHLPDDEIYAGGIYKIGSVYLKAVQPRFPCFKLSVRFANDFVLKNFVKVGKHGTYFSVVQEGRLNTGDTITLIEKPEQAISIQQIADAYYYKNTDRAFLKKIISLNCLPEDLKQHFIDML